MCWQKKKKKKKKLWWAPETFRKRIGEILLGKYDEETDSEQLAREVDLPDTRDDALVPDQKERSDDALAV